MSGGDRRRSDGGAGALSAFAGGWRCCARANARAGCAYGKSGVQVTERALLRDPGGDLKDAAEVEVVGLRHPAAGAKRFAEVALCSDGGRGRAQSETHGDMSASGVWLWRECKAGWLRSKGRSHELCAHRRL